MYTTMVHRSYTIKAVTVYFLLNQISEARTLKSRLYKKIYIFTHTYYTYYILTMTINRVRNGKLNVIKCCTRLQWALLERDGHRKWRRFTECLHGGVNKPGGTERQRKHVVRSRPGRFPDPDWRQNSRLVFGEAWANYMSTWERQNDVNARPKLTSLTSPPQSEKHAGWSVSLCSTVTLPAAITADLQHLMAANKLAASQNFTPFFVSPGPSIATRIFAGIIQVIIQPLVYHTSWNSWN